eukprot:CAMPEP_0203673906 /NCGR_PEP_ID=MMETSP0090-20130426/14348_1 /ASSEMBLY_ACC=CAM_ASM_001088 /TAXON_ID=426623 /ORGANISM="Chaetoceros affinis, Strain CCMP159" /LENGTH=96 /DNA_ID=CAMNT_0050539655 /DNA_START=202 /DNA_END=488 /DNA_ORIENTATION=-
MKGELQPSRITLSSRLCEAIVELSGSSCPLKNRAAWLDAATGLDLDDEVTGVEEESVPAALVVPLDFNSSSSSRDELSSVIFCIVLERWYPLFGLT